MNFKKKLKEAAILVGAFLIAVVVFSYFTNKGNDDMTADMGTATYPLISFTYNGYSLNSIAGYAGEMNIPSVRDTITPVAGKRLDVVISAYENEVQKAVCKVYTLDGKKVVCEDEVKNPGNEISLDLSAENILVEERVLQIALTLKGDKKVYFYTRIADSENASLIECLDYANKFHDNALGKSDDMSFGAALEPNEEGDNSTFSHVNIHSSSAQVGWKDLEPSVENGERWSIKEMNNVTTALQIEYIVRCKGEENDGDTYKVKEFFRLRYDKERKRTYLIDYDRTMEQIFDPTKKVLSEKGILLGITSPDVSYLTNKDGTIVSFVQAGELWSYNQETDEISLVFSFSSAENMDERNYTEQHEVRLLGADENGNVTFAVYGYMNRGAHEGEVGIAVYYYNVQKNSVEEKVFIPSNKFYGKQVSGLGELLHYSVDNKKLYLLADGTVYETNVEKGRTKEIVKGLAPNQYVVSGDGHLLAYQTAESETDVREIIILNLASGQEKSVTCKEGESIHPLGFVRNDFVYGIAKTGDMGQTVSGEAVIPMYKVEIQNSKGKVIKTHEENGVYVLDAVLEENRVILERATREGNVYTAIAQEYISNNEEEKERKIFLESYTTELKEKQMRLTYKDGIADKEPKVLKPKQVLFENPTVVSFEHTGDEKKYYAYGHGELKGVYDTAGDAIQEADNFGGVVLDQNQAYVWERGNRDLNFSIPGADALAANIKEQLTGGSSPMQIMEKARPGASMDLSGCDAEQLAYIINQGRPVIAMLNGSTSVILVGYGENTIVYVDMGSSEKKRITFKQMDEMTAASRHTYIA